MDKIRFGGMATGLDTDTLVKQMMQPYRLKVDKQKQDKQVLQWKQNIYRDIITDIRALKSSYLDSIKPDDNLLMQKNYSAYDISSTGPSTATATAGVGVVEGNYTVNVVDLAKGAKISGGALTGKTTSSKLSELNPSILADTDINFKINVNGTDKTITLADVGNKTISEFISAINTQTNGEVSARFSELTQTFSIETNKTGVNSSVEILSAGTTADVITAFGIADVDSQEIGSNAKINITPPGGALITVSTKETNDFTIDGINYSLKGTGTTTLSVTANTDKTYDKIMGFVTKYNELIDKVKEKIEQKKQYSYTPLTDDQKKDMKAEDIKAWEDKAKEGLIKGDNSLNTMLTSMRNDFFDSVGGVSISLKDLGFTTSKDTSQRGKIVIDERLTADEAKKKFSDAMKSNGAEVANLFSKSGTTYDEKGILQRLNDTIEKYTKPFGEKGLLLKKAGIKGNTTEFNNLLSEQMLEKDKFITELNKKLANKETNYYAMFSRLEKSMNQMNSQSTWLTQQLGGGQ
jgi:flagellar hook-associated protein 2